MIVTKHIKVRMQADEIKNITPAVEVAVEESGINNGIVTIFVVGSTAAVTTMEYEPGLLKDIPKALERIAPSSEEYEHHKTWHDDNGKSHVRASMIGPSLVAPVKNGNLTLGHWQQVILMNLDTSPREREIILQILGE